MEEEVGEICITSSCPFFLKWNIPDLFSRLQKLKICKSPEFLFCDQNWSFRIWKHSFFSESMTLLLTDNPFRRHDISYDVSVINPCGREIANVRTKFLKHEFIATLYTFPTPIDMEMYQNETEFGGTWSISCVLRCTSHSVELQSVTILEGKEELNEENADNSMEKENTICSTQKEIIPAIIDSTRLLRDMEALFTSGKGSDATLILQGRKFAVHTSILRARSSVFDAMFTHDVVESTTGEVNITDFDPDVFHDFLLYLYCAKVKKLSLENAIGLYSAADKYDAQELKTKCVEFMSENLSLDMFCSVVSLALQHQESFLLEASTKFFVGNMKQIIVKVEWQEFLKENPTAANELFIKSSDFYVPPKAKERTCQR